MKSNLLKEELLIIDKDKMLSDLGIIKEAVYNGALQDTVEKITIKKKIYKKENEVFNRNGRAKVTLDCVFVLHTSKRSSFVKVIGLNNEVVYTGNYLHSNRKDSSYKRHIETIKRMHDLQIIKENF